ncbi:MAG: Eco57I restriction-modification methylase domain-containing protein [Planctomycetota bacterium]|jgi:hypothetical protein
MASPAAVHELAERTEVDEAFFDEIQSWYEQLGQNVALANRGISQRALDFAVRRIVRRIVFLRVCENRAIGPHGTLRTLSSGPGVCRRLEELFRGVERCNPGLARFTGKRGRGAAVDLTPAIRVDDEVLRDVVQSTYRADGPFESAVLPVEVLGQVHERLLGKVIRLRGGRVEIAEKPGLKKAEGAYYTPSYIVDYMVRHTVGDLVDGGDDATPRKAAGLRILDPACGAGSFLIEAYQYLLDWHRDWYEKHDAERHARGRNPRLYRGRAGDWRLTLAERKRILRNNVYGVDVDPQAVGAAGLSLLLKVFEGEVQETPPPQPGFFHNRALPDLADNVKCGNSLIGPDFHQSRQTSLDQEQFDRVDAVDWEAEFPDVFKGANPGFDVVIGNPPYRRELGYKDLLDEIAATEFGRRHRSARMDLWYYFVHRGLEVLKRRGLLSFIVNAYWVAGAGAEHLMAALRDSAHVDEIFFFGKLKVFGGVSGQHMILRVTNGPSAEPTTIRLPRSDSDTTARPFVLGQSPVVTFTKTQEQLFRENRVDLEPPSDALLLKLQHWSPLGGLGKVRQGIAENPASINKRTNDKYGSRWQLGEGVFALRSDEVESLGLSRAEKGLLRPYHDLCDVGRYRLAEEPSLVLIYSTRNSCPDIDAYPSVSRHLSRFRVVMENRRETRKGANRWWHLHWPRDERLWRSPKILSVQMARRPSFVPTRKPVYVPFSMNVFLPGEATPEHLNYLCGVLNSRLMWKWCRHHAKRRGVGLEINGNVLRRCPIRRVDFSDAADRAQHDRVVDRVKRMLDLHGQLASARTAHEKTALQRQIEATDRVIDRLVYELYGLTDDEIAVVEAATR